jgi:hypothetical protein
MIPILILKPIQTWAGIALAKYADSRLKKWLARRRAARRAAGTYTGNPAPVLVVALGLGLAVALAGCVAWEGFLDNVTDALVPETATNAVPGAVTNAPPGGTHNPEGHEIETIKVAGDGLWKPDTLTYLVPTRQRPTAPGPGWSANGAAIAPEHIGRAQVVAADGTVRGFLLWPGNTPLAGRPVDGKNILAPGTATPSNRFGAWPKLSKARVRAAGDRIVVYDIFGQIIAELPVPDPAKRSEGRR